MTDQKKTNSSGAVALRQKLSQGMLLFVNHISRVRVGALSTAMFRDIEEYDQLCRSFTGRSIYDLKVFEIGYGARPYRLASMISLGIDARGVDLDAPMLEFSAKAFREIYRKNGWERLIKSVIRFIIADIIERRQLKKALASRSMAFRMPPERFLVGDALEVIDQMELVDLFVSEDVFEHIPGSDLRQVIDRMANKLSPNGLALIRPNVFTGITGGHRVEWFEDNIGRKWCSGWSAPWGHLMDRGLVGDTYLNRLRRSDYRSLFETRFNILGEWVKYPDLGREYLTEEVAQGLPGYGDDELFSNQVMFVLMKKK